MLQALVAVGHEIIKASWTAASVIVKYYILATVLYLAYRKNLDLESFQESLLDNSRVFILGLLLLGVISAGLGLQLSPVLSEVSQVIALAYLGYLFWVY
ncbi:hypothetical protein GKQ38_04700 [Candidatus Nanohaloarchaea archaeon]|nr:hypothetical protein GKQ38_04700 [Candidatus Nanohaloarchaea archaeon]